ncbi:DUF6520 family protein [Dawidia soli]|uniref:Uncharacterized protein n=1 Tax=Dawidia soli TaxID=2782352 RepID=A0AAP2DAR3_9BACT|nr:DUF6520 family protein [Dawidia soli]MBT1688299.1 hypothetical protein [Dawidia soli]
MKTKNLSLAAFALVLAVGSAFASFLAPENVYVRAKLKSDPNGLTQCVNTGVQCDDAGSNLCTVNVPVTGGTTQVQTDATFRPYRVTCQVQLHNTSAAPISSSITTIDRIVQ